MQTISLEKFRAFLSPCTINLNGKNALFYGENGSGKSSLYDAIKICFHKSKLFSTKIPTSVTLPADRKAHENDIINSYNNQKNPLSNFSLYINGDNYSTFSTIDYDVNIINAEDIAPCDILEVDTLIQTAMINFADANKYVTDNKNDIEILLNDFLQKDFHEPNLSLTLNKVDNHWRVSILDSNRMSTAVNKNLCSSLNEAKLRIIKFLILTTAILENGFNKSTSHHVLVLDDIISSMDSANRALVIKYIHDYFSSYQKLIFTHSPSFFNVSAYSFMKAWEENEKWITFKIVEKEGDAEVVEYDAMPARKIKKQYHPGRNESTIGNFIRQRFEFLVQEFSKLICVGGLAELGQLLNEINRNDTIYFQYDTANKKVLTVFDMIKEISSAIDIDTSSSPISTQLKRILNQYKANTDIAQLKNALSELMIYQKVSMNPLSHSTGFTAMTTTQEIYRSLSLLIRMENLMNGLVGRDVYSY